MNYLRPEAEWIVYVPHTRRTAIGLRGQIGYLRPFLGGENQIRGFDLRTVGPISEDSQLTGGNKFVLFNAEYYLDIHSSVRALAFHDAGQAFDETLTFETWYDLPSLRKECVITLTYGFVDNDGTSFQRIVDFKVAP